MPNAITTTDDARHFLAERFPALSNKQLSFVAQYVASGGNGTEAARQAGYAVASAHVEAHRQLQKPNVLKAIYDLTVVQLGASLPAALASIRRLSGSAKSEYVQLEASKDLLDRAGMAAPKQVRVSGDVHVSFDFS